MPELATALENYFRGRRVRLDAKLDWSGHSAFQAAVWRACRRIAYGQTCSYQDLATRVGKPRAARAIGRVMACNPCPIVVPCHRVIKSDGSLGGYSGTHGVVFKRRLLDMEAAVSAGKT
jgi:methylated-DNA-[protein]-cysteine S-methyltransferase